MEHQILLQGVSYFKNFANTLERIDQKLITLSQSSLLSEQYSAEHRKLIKLLSRATTSLRLFREKLFTLTLPNSLRVLIDQLNEETLRFQRRFLMRTTLPENAQEQLHTLPLAKTAQAFSKFTQAYTESPIIPSSLFNSKEHSND